MGIWSDFRDGYRLEFPWLTVIRHDRNARRPLTDEDHIDWETAQDLRAAGERRPKPKTINEVAQLLTWTNPLRMRRIRKDYAWMQKRMEKMGLNPEDARYLL